MQFSYGNQSRKENVECATDQTNWRCVKHLCKPINLHLYNSSINELLIKLDINPENATEDISDVIGNTLLLIKNS